MQRRNFLKNVGLFSLLPAVPAAASATTTDQPVPRSIQGKVTAAGKGIAGVAVSDGYSIVVTDTKGQYRLQPHPDASFVFISIPAGYQIPHENNIARFYQAIQKDGASQTANFTLDKLATDDDKHAFIVWGDTQIWDKEDAEKLKTISAPDTRELIATLGNVPVHGIGCGDLVFDKFELFPDYKQAVATTGVPYFQVIGNHDMDLKARTDDQSQQTFKATFGPTYYSFNRGKIHYVVLDNVFFISGSYIGYITENQFSWLEKDLKLVPAGSTVVLSLHIPVADAENGRRKPQSTGGISNKEALLEILKPYKVHIMSGHTHYNENWVEGDIMEHNHGTVCGAWWTGPICSDGTPCGYGVYEVNGADISWYYKSIGQPKEYQLVIYKKGEVSSRPNAIVANVWNWDPAWKIEWLEDDALKGAMEQFIDLDPEAFRLYKGDALPAKHKWVEPSPTDHLFAATPSTTTKKVTVKATDRFGKVYQQTIQLP